MNRYPSAYKQAIATFYPSKMVQIHYVKTNPPDFNFIRGILLIISQFSYTNSYLFDLAAAQRTVRGAERHRPVVKFETQQWRI